MKYRITRIDLNSDMGERDTPEGRAADAGLLPLITSVNIACGGHAGTPALMRRTAQLAAQHGVAIGAHPGFHDPAHFGRREQSLSPHETETLIVDQIALLVDVLAEDRLSLTHVKPHGALYNMAAKDPAIAGAIVRAVQAIDRTLLLYALAGSVLAQAAQAAGLTVVREAFADRAYRADGSLVPRSEPGALLATEAAVRRQLRRRAGRLRRHCRPSNRHLSDVDAGRLAPHRTHSRPSLPSRPPFTISVIRRRPGPVCADRPTGV